MLKVEKPQDLLQHVGQELGPSEWLTVTQEMIDKFADATGDHQWIHVDVERAKKEMPGGKTIAHGYLTLSLLPRLAPTLMKVENRRRGQKLLKVEPVEDNGFRVTSEMTMEVEGNSRPAMVAETLGIVYG
jgi:MaoC like domain